MSKLVYVCEGGDCSERGSMEIFLELRSRLKEQAPDAKVEDTGLMMRDVVVDWVRKHGGFDPKPASEEGGK